MDLILKHWNLVCIRSPACLRVGFSLDILGHAKSNSAVFLPLPRDSLFLAQRDGAGANVSTQPWSHRSHRGRKLQIVSRPPEDRPIPVRGPRRACVKPILLLIAQSHSRSFDLPPLHHVPPSVSLYKRLQRCLHPMHISHAATSPRSSDPTGAASPT